MHINKKDVGAFAVDFTHPSVTRQQKDAVINAFRAFGRTSEYHDIKITPGFIDIIPKGFHKGKVIALICGQFLRGIRDLVPFHFGDGSTDEKAFRECRRRGGHGVAVNRRLETTEASCLIYGVSTVYKILSAIYHMIIHGPETHINHHRAQRYSSDILPTGSSSSSATVTRRNSHRV